MATTAKPTVGFISPPTWLDPTPDEFRICTQDRVSVQQTSLDLPKFDWRFESIAATEPLLIRAACRLASAGCSVVANVGTPFGWAGLRDITEAHERNRRITDASGAVGVSSVAAIFRVLERWNTTKVALACTYYPPKLRDLWSGFVTSSGIEVVTAQTMVEQGILRPDAGHWAPSAEQIVRSVSLIAETVPSADAIVITGAASRTMSILGKLQSLTGVRVIGSDTALYFELASELGFPEIFRDLDFPIPPESS
jgi:maleate isomerase